MFEYADVAQSSVDNTSLTIKLQVLLALKVLETLSARDLNNSSPTQTAWRCMKNNQK
jgi:hypothetical protein